MASLLDLVKNVAGGIQNASAGNPIIQAIQKGLQQAELSNISYQRERSLGQTRGQQLVGNKINPYLAQTNPTISSANKILNSVQQNPILQAMSGAIQGMNMGLGKAPLQPPQGIINKAAYGAGNLAGALNPKSLTGKVVGGIVGATNPILSKVVGQTANRAVVGRIAAGVGNVIQGVPISAAYGRNPIEGAPLDFATGALFGPNMFGKTIAKGFDQGKTAATSKIDSIDLAKVENLNDQLHSIKKDGNILNISKEKFDSIMNEMHALGKKYLSNEELVKIQDKYGTDDKSLIKAYKEVASKIFETDRNSTSGTTGISMGIVGNEQKQRGFVGTVKESPNSTMPLKQGVSGTYEVMPNQQVLSQAQEGLKVSGWQASMDKIKNEPFSAENNLLGQEMMRQAQQTGRHDDAIAIAETLARKGTEAGQSVQAFSVWSKMTPEGMLRYANQQVEQAKKTAPILNKIFGMKNLKLTAEDSKQITDLMNRANASTTEVEQAGFVRQAFELVGKKLPWGVSDILDEYRYNNMLSNPLTHLRNIYSNLAQTYITRPGTLAAEGKPIEAVKYELGAIKGLPEAFGNFAKSISGNKQFGRLDEVIKSGPVKPSRLPVLNMPSKLLEGMDQFFSTLVKSGEMARGANEADAKLMADYSLFRGDLKPQGQGVVLNKIDDLTKAVYQLRKVGLGWFIPFVKTPMNVAKQMLEYSPAGVSTIVGASKPREQLAKSLLGSMVMAFGAKMAMEGRTTWAAPTDKKEKDLFYASGKKPFSVKMGDKWVPMQYLGVFQWAAGLPAAYKFYNDESRTALTDDKLTKMARITASIAEQFSQQTFVSGLASFVNMANGDLDFNMKRNLAYTAGQLVPLSGLQRYVATALDPVFRKTTTFTDQLKSGIPGMTQGLEPYKTPDGEVEKRNITNFVAPYGMGIQNNQYEQRLQDRRSELQNNALIAEAKKKIESGGKAVDVGAIKVIKVGDKIREIDMGRIDNIPQYPTLTGDTLLDKELIKDYKSTLTSIRNDITDLYKSGQINQQEAAKYLQDTYSTMPSSGSSKKIKAKLANSRKIKIGKLKRASISLKISKPKIKKTNGFRIITSTQTTPKTKIINPKIRWG